MDEEARKKRGGYTIHVDIVPKRRSQYLLKFKAAANERAAMKNQAPSVTTIETGQKSKKKKRKKKIKPKTEIQTDIDNSKPRMSVPPGKHNSEQETPKENTHKDANSTSKDLMEPAGSTHQTSILHALASGQKSKKKNRNAEMTPKIGIQKDMDNNKPQTGAAPSTQNLKKSTQIKKADPNANTIMQSKNKPTSDTTVQADDDKIKPKKSRKSDPKMSASTKKGNGKKKNKPPGKSK